MGPALESDSGKPPQARGLPPSESSDTGITQKDRHTWPCAGLQVCCVGSQGFNFFKT